MNMKTAVKYTKGQNKRIERLEKSISELFYVGLLGVKAYESAITEFTREIKEQYGEKAFDDYIKYAYGEMFG